MNRFIAVSAVLALVATTVPGPVAALDLKKTVRDVTRSVSDTVGGLTGNDDDDDSSGGGSGTGGSTGGSTSGGGSVASASASVGKNGVKAKVGSSLLGGTQVSVGVLNQSGAAQLGAQVGSTQVGAAVLSNRQLATLRIDANPPGTGNVAVPGSGGGKAVVGVTPDYARKLMASLNRAEEKILMQRCAMILRSPKAFDAELVLLCQLVAKL